MKIEEHLFVQKNKNRIFSSAIITHKNCPDGSAAAVIAKKIFPNIFVFSTTHQRINEQVEKVVHQLDNGENLFICDICCNQETLKKVFPQIQEKKIFLGIYEHHESTKWLSEIELPEGVEGEILFDLNRSASKIFYEHYLAKHPEIKVFDDFIAVNNDRDLWLQKDGRSAGLAKLHQVLGDQDYISRFLENPNMTLTEKERFILEHEMKQEKKKHDLLLKNIHLKEADEEGFRYGLIYGEADSSDLLNKAIEKFDLEYAILINLNTRRGSIRSRGNKDCVAYSKKYGGGGHRCASGFRFDFKYPEF